MRKGFIMLVGVLLHWGATAQGPVDHWEAVVQDGSTWDYLLPTSQPLPYWMFTNFAATGWGEGISGFGYGDGDDATVIPPSNSIYMRHVFQVDDASSFPAALLAVDYDDGFVAYLNGTEIARGNAGSPERCSPGMPFWTGGTKRCSTQVERPI